MNAHIYIYCTPTVKYYFQIKLQEINTTPFMDTSLVDQTRVTKFSRIWVLIR